MSGEWISDSHSYVTPRDRGTGDAWGEEAARTGKKGTQRLVEVTECVPPPYVADAFGLGANEPVVVRQRLILLDDQPVELADSYYPVHIARGTALAEHRKIPGGSPTLLHQLGHAVAEVFEDVSGRMPTPEERDALHLGDEEPVLLLARVSTDAAGHPVETMLSTMTTQGRHLHYRMRTS
ncbi:UTRA domain-containing protein [Streptomyces lasiicapitis]|uniref:GntR family transcriptional regulator n=1 Tax=Streptomyces lasiicapitis TaxID=1923961 RepID=UPI00332FA2AF